MSRRYRPFHRRHPPNEVVGLMLLAGPVAACEEPEELQQVATVALRPLAVLDGMTIRAFLLLTRHSPCCCDGVTATGHPAGVAALWPC
jgi:hypothetical protein